MLQRNRLPLFVYGVPIGIRAWIDLGEFQNYLAYNRVCRVNIYGPIALEHFHEFSEQEDKVVAFPVRRYADRSPILRKLVFQRQFKKLPVVEYDREYQQVSSGGFGFCFYYQKFGC